jgi:hypothetical protein
MAYLCMFGAAWGGLGVGLEVRLYKKLRDDTVIHMYLYKYFLVYFQHC